MSQWSKIAQISNTADFYSSFKIFSSHCNSQFVEYVEKTWLPLAPRFVDAWTKRIPQFDHWTTSQIESAHSYIKKHLLNSSTNFPEVVKLITLALESQHHKISSEFHQQKVTTLRNIQKIFTPCFGKITHYALRRAQNEFNPIKWSKELGKCNHSFMVQTGIPFQHWIAYLVNCGEQIEPTEFCTQWHMKVSPLLSLFVFIFFPFFPFPYPFFPFPHPFCFFLGGLVVSGLVILTAVGRRDVAKQLCSFLNGGC
jgi:hypothetical protein